MSAHVAAHAEPETVTGQAIDTVLAAAAWVAEAVGLFLYGTFLSVATLAGAGFVVAAVAPMWW